MTRTEVVLTTILLRMTLAPTIRPQKKILHVPPGLNHSIALLDYTFKSYHQHKISCNDSTPQHDKDDNRNPGSSLLPLHRKSCLCKHLLVPKKKKKKEIHPVRLIVEE